MPHAIHSFDDLALLDPPSLQQLLRAVEHERLALALRGASGAVREEIFANVAARIAAQLRATLAESVSVSYREVDGAQGAILAQANQMHSLGLLRSPRRAQE